MPVSGKDLIQKCHVFFKAGIDFRKTVRFGERDFKIIIGAIEREQISGDRTLRLVEKTVIIVLERQED